MFNKILFGQRLRKIRRAKDETQSVLARLIGVTITQISDMENGKTLTTFDKLVIICEHYMVSSDYLLGLTDDPTPFNRNE